MAKTYPNDTWGNKNKLAQAVEELGNSDFTPDAIIAFLHGSIKTYQQGIGLHHTLVEQIVRENLPEKVLVDKAFLDRMWKRVMLLDYLEAAGVDNWSGYSYAFELAEEDGNEI